MDDSTKNVLIERMVSKPGLRGKVDAKCMECIYDPYAKGSWRKQVAECTSLSCPLFAIRSKSITNQQ
jgi:hypothetical protein